MGSQEAGALSYEMAVNDVRRTYTKNFTAGHDCTWGSKNMCLTPASADVVVSVKVRDLVINGQTVSWSLTRADFSECRKGEYFRSRSFELVDRTLQVRFYPNGVVDAADGNCSLFLWSQEAGALSYEMAVNDVRST